MQERADRLWEAKLNFRTKKAYGCNIFTPRAELNKDPMLAVTLTFFCGFVDLIMHFTKL